MHTRVVSLWLRSAPIALVALASLNVHAEDIVLRATLCRPAWEWAPYFRSAIENRRLVDLGTGRGDAERAVGLIRGFSDGGVADERLVPTTFVSERGDFRGIAAASIRNSRPPRSSIEIQTPGVQRTFRSFESSRGREIRVVRETRAQGITQHLLWDWERLSVGGSELGDAPFGEAFMITGTNRLSRGVGNGGSGSGSGTGSGSGSGTGSGNGSGNGSGQGGTGNGEEPPLVLVPLPPAAWAGLMCLSLAGVHHWRRNRRQAKSVL